MRMRSLIIATTLVSLVSAVSDSPEDLEFSAWKLKYGKIYHSEEEESRRKMIWLQNRKLILEHNKLADQGIESYSLGMNHFGDMESHEICCHGACNRTKKHDLHD